jgi:hypothetical protein
MDAAFAGLTAEQLAAPGLAGDWSARELAIHLEAWFRVALQSIPIFAAGNRREEEYDDFDAWNQRFVAEGESLSAEDAVERLRGTYGTLLAYLQELPADLFERHAIFDTIEGVSWGHFGEHYYDAWRFRGANGWLPPPLTLDAMPATRVEGLRTLWSDYDRFYASLLGLSESQLSEPGVDGEWSLRDVVAHIAAWQRAMVEELPKVLAGLRASEDTSAIDDFNKRAVERGRGLSIEALFTEYHAANNHFFAYANTLVDGAFAPGSPAREWLLLPHGSEHYPRTWDWRRQRGV